jgi:hypothetical protein
MGYVEGLGGVSWWRDVADIKTLVIRVGQEEDIFREKYETKIGVMFHGRSLWRN